MDASKKAFKYINKSVVYLKIHCRKTVVQHRYDS